MLDRKWEAIGSALRRYGFRGEDSRVIDVGASSANEVHRFIALGCRRDSIVCLDILRENALGASRSATGIAAVTGDASSIPFKDERFDLTYQSVMVSSVSTLEMQRAIAREMVRVTKRGGFIVWYDLRYKNPFNREIKPIARVQLESWFSDCDGEIRALTLIPTLARQIAPLSRPAYRLLERFPFLRSHLLAVLRRI